MTKPDAATRAAERIYVWGIPDDDRADMTKAIPAIADIIRTEFAAELKRSEKWEEVEELCRLLEPLEGVTFIREPEQLCALLRSFAQLARSIREEG